MSNSRDQIEFAELSKPIKNHKVSDIRNYNLGKIEEAVKSGCSMKSASFTYATAAPRIWLTKGGPSACAIAHVTSQPSG